MLSESESKDLEQPQHPPPPSALPTPGHCKTRLCSFLHANPWWIPLQTLPCPNLKHYSSNKEALDINYLHWIFLLTLDTHGLKFFRKWEWVPWLFSICDCHLSVRMERPVNEHRVPSNRETLSWLKDNLKNGKASEEMFKTEASMASIGHPHLVVKRFKATQRRMFYTFPRLPEATRVRRQLSDISSQIGHL